MLKNIQSNKGSTVKEKLALISLSQSERARVYAALYTAERLANGWLWVYRGTQRLLGRVFLKLGLGA